ncbi:bifunctional phosphopantothenoylcysteine decarboxylase/phosphopantothenate--cysteine ligase CoaBC [Candidatus Gottesmanbacteria bacterium]|nr:bifunctional phosphopantothenoylcysteine decarboxylase/phosphopantothenate--cysteine ligase CoaBC [Candidatus Gottesmanbacteria bacterium]
MKHKVVIGITSGIAAYKIVDLIKILKTQNIKVEIIMTATAVTMFGKEMFEKASGKKVYTDLITNDFDYQEVLKKREVEHIKIADTASLFVIAPSTANIIAKVAAGIADDFLTTTLLATTAPVLVCPSMNVHMWTNPIVQENLAKLKGMGYFIKEPDSGELACGYKGVGRLSEPAKIADEILKLLSNSDKLKRKKIIVTAGGTSEPIDAVRTITNRASGKMGSAIAEACFLQGAEVLILRAKNSIIPRYDIKSEVFETAKDLENLAKKYVKSYDVIFHTAAVSDFIPENKLDKKLDSGQSFTLKLKSVPKILHKIKSWNPKIKLIGFKAVYKLSEKELIDTGMKKLRESKSDFIIVNDVGKEGVGFAVDTNEVYIISTKGFVEKIKKAPKKEIAGKILDFVF